MPVPSPRSPGMPPTFVAMHGNRLAIASSRTMGMPSVAELKTNASADVKYGATFDVGPRNCTPAARPPSQALRLEHRPLRTISHQPNLQPRRTYDPGRG